jgi:hypothetical protein
MRKLPAGRDGGQERYMLRLCSIQYLIWLDMLPPVARPKDERWNVLGLVLCAPLYGYGLYKLCGG